MNAPVAVLLLFAALGAVDEALGGKLGVAPAFRNGLAAMGPLCLSMAGIYSVAVSALSGMAGQGGGALPFDAALPAGLVLAPDMGGWAIAQALDVSLVSLMNNSDYTAGSRGETGDDAGESGFCVLPPDGRRTMPIDLPGVRYQLLNAQQLAPGHAGDVTMVLCTLQPGCSSSGKMVSHLYTEVCFVIAGRIRALRAGGEELLGPGDTIRVTPGVLHDFYNVGDAPAVVLAVTF